MREQALDDGVLYDVSSMAQEAGFVFPVAITASLKATINPTGNDEENGQSYQGRLWDVLWMASRRAKIVGKNMFRYNLIVATYSDRARQADEYELLAIISPGDKGEPVITIGFPEDF